MIKTLNLDGMVSPLHMAEEVIFLLCRKRCLSRAGEPCQHGESCGTFVDPFYFFK